MGGVEKLKGGGGGVDTMEDTMLIFVSQQPFRFCGQTLVNGGKFAKTKSIEIRNLIYLTDANFERVNLIKYLLKIKLDV